MIDASPLFANSVVGEIRDSIRSQGADDGDARAYFDVKLRQASVELTQRLADVGQLLMAMADQPAPESWLKDQVKAREIIHDRSTTYTISLDAIREMLTVFRAQAANGASPGDAAVASIKSLQPHLDDARAALTKRVGEVIASEMAMSRYIESNQG